MANSEEMVKPRAIPYALGISVTINSKDSFEESSSVIEKQSNDIDDLIMRRFNLYEQELKKRLEQVDTNPYLSSFTNYPSLHVLIDTDEYQVIFDSELLETLVTLYINDGWHPIWNIEQQLGSKCSGDAKQRLMPSSGGVYVEDAAQWIPVQSYFLFIRNILAILIRNALSSIEKKAADLVVARLNFARDEVANIWQKFSYEREEVEDDYSDEQGRVSRSSYNRFNADKEKISTLYNDLHDIYLQSQNLEKITERLQRTSGNISDAKRHIRGARTWNQRERLKKFNSKLEGLQLQKANLEKLVSGSAEFLQLSTESAIRENPTSLLVMGALNNMYSPTALEQILGNILWQFLRDVESDAVKSSKSVSCKLPPILGDLKDPRVIKNYANALGPDGVDGIVIDSAIEMLDGNLLLFGILNEQILDDLIEQELISKESFEYIVCIRYSSILPTKLKEAEENKDKFLKAISTASAALSIATLVTPETAPISAPLRGVSFLVNMYVLAHHYQNLAKKYASLNQRMTELLVSDKAIGPEILARVGELAILRKEICNEMTLEALLPLVMVSLDKFQSLKILLRDYALIMDIQTLAEASSV